MFRGGVWVSEHLVAIMEEHGEYCLRVAYLYVKDWAIAEEIVQDVFFLIIGSRIALNIEHL